jgi:hypothetical protein
MSLNSVRPLESHINTITAHVINAMPQAKVCIRDEDVFLNWYRINIIGDITSSAMNKLVKSGKYIISILFSFF